MELETRYLICLLLAVGFNLKSNPTSHDAPFRLTKSISKWLCSIEEIVKVAMKKLTLGMTEHNKAISAAKTEDAKAHIKQEQQKTTAGLRVCNNILSMTQPLHSKSPTFIGANNKIKLSWQEPAKPSQASAGAKRGATASANGSGNSTKKGRGDGPVQNQLMNRALEGLSRGGGGRNYGRGRGWGRSRKR